MCLRTPPQQAIDCEAPAQQGICGERPSINLLGDRLPSMTLSLKFKTSQIVDITNPIIQLGLSMYEVYSVIGCKLRLIEDVDRIENYFNQFGHGQFGLYKPEHGGGIKVKTIKLNDGRTRETLVGWGYIQLLIEKGSSGYRYGYSVNTQVRAEKWYSSSPDFGDPSLWNWDEITRSVRRLKKVAQQGSADGARDL